MKMSEQLHNSQTSDKTNTSPDQALQQSVGLAL
jgi:hypothetical protein